ncbi:MAG: glycosyltransferase family 4 protein [Planctomycetota bacterium]|nr:glycosyltransferase family 4 protein [Planctomycetota bacterium]
MTIACLTNQYPHTSHSFIRREIAAVEAKGVRVVRYSIRRSSAKLVDPGDVEEQKKTRVVLDGGMLLLIMGLLAFGLGRPARFVRGLWLAMGLGYRSDRGLLLHCIYLAEACVLVRWFERDGVEHVHAHFGTNSAAVAALCHALGGPAYSFTVHGPDEFDRPEAMKLGMKIAGAAFVVAISEYTRSQLYRWCPHEHWGKIHVVHCGVDGSFLGRKVVPISSANRLVCVGRLSEQKGQLLLVEALGKVVREGRQVELVLVGDGPMRAEIEALIQRLGLAESVKVIGWKSGDEVRQEILAARAMVLPSFAEGLPVVIMEALALGRPVISTYIAGIPELVKSGVTGWLVPAGSVEELAAAMREVLEAPAEKLDAMGWVGAGWVAERHDATIEAEKLVWLLAEQRHQSSTRADHVAVPEIAKEIRRC